MPEETVNLGEEGLSDGDDISPYIDDYWGDGTAVHIPAGSYRYDGSGLHGKRGDCSLIGSEAGVEFHRPDDGSQVRPTIQCTHGTMRVENITVRGASPSSRNTNGSRWRFDALDPDSRVEVVNVNHPDGSTDNSDSNAFLTYEDHRGTLHFKNCYVAGFGNSSFYTNLGYRSDEENPVIIENCVIVNANGAIRGGHNGSIYKDCTFIWREKPSTWVNGSSLARGIRWDHGGRDELVENCHFYFAGDIGAAAGALEFEDFPIGGTVRDVYIHTEGDHGGIYDKGGMDGWTFENVNVTGPGSASIDADVSVGDTPPDLRNEGVVWMPESETVRPGEGAPSGDLFTILSTTAGAHMTYEFEAEGAVIRARDQSTGASSVGEDNVTIDESGDLVVVTGKTGDEHGDAFRVDGRVLSFQKTGGESDYRLLLNGEEFTSGGGGEGDGDGGPVVFEVVVDGEVHPFEVADPSGVLGGAGLESPVVVTIGDTGQEYVTAAEAREIAKEESLSVERVREVVRDYFSGLFRR